MIDLGLSLGGVYKKQNLQQKQVSSVFRKIFLLEGCEQLQIINYFQTID